MKTKKKKKKVIKSSKKKFLFHLCQCSSTCSSQRVVHSLMISYQALPLDHHDDQQRLWEKEQNKQKRKSKRKGQKLNKKKRTRPIILPASNVWQGTNSCSSWTISWWCLVLLEWLALLLLLLFPPLFALSSCSLSCLSSSSHSCNLPNLDNQWRYFVWIWWKYNIILNRVSTNLSSNNVWWKKEK